MEAVEDASSEPLAPLASADTDAAGPKTPSGKLFGPRSKSEPRNRVLVEELQAYGEVSVRASSA
jgi:hypothetical protein